MKSVRTLQLTSILYLTYFLAAYSGTVVSPNAAAAQEAAVCSSDVYVANLEIEKNLYPCPDNCKLEFGNLIMQRGTSIFIPQNCENFELSAQSARFFGNNLIGADFDFSYHGALVYPESGARSSNIIISLDNVYLDFEPVEESLSLRRTIRDSSYSSPVFGLTWDPINPTSLRLPAQHGYLGNERFGILVFSRGNSGQTGPQGPKGANATRKHCGTGSGSGNEAGDGGRGIIGYPGGAGGEIFINIGVLLEDGGTRRSVTQHDVIGISMGGPGGRGGSGGDGGDGVAGHNCVLVGQRSGFPAGELGEEGPQGPNGASGIVEIELSVFGNGNGGTGIPTIPPLLDDE